MKNKEKRGCQTIKQDGRQCKAAAIAESTYCFFHHPEKGRARKAAQQAGGIARSRGNTEVSDGTRDRPLETAGDGISLLAEIINKVLKGQLKPKVGTAIGYLLNVFFRAYPQRDLEARLKVLEEVYEAQPPAPGYQEVPAWAGEQFDFRLKPEGDIDGES